jgi:hypothetical protein
LGLIGAFLGGGIGVLIATTGDEGEVFIASNQLITVAQVQEKLRSEGWLNVQIAEQAGISKSRGRKTAKAER